MTAHWHTAGRVVALAIPLTLAVSLTLVSTSLASSPRPPSWILQGAYSPSVDPANFVRTIDNRYFPLRPGTGFRYRGVADGKAQTDDMLVTSQVENVLGIRCTVVKDTVSQGGKPTERTFDWYAQDKHGNVWYMGENSLELRNGRFVRASDSWEAGIKGAQPGIIMLGHPRSGAVYRQEYYPPGGALDQAKILGTSGPVTVHAGAFKSPLVTIEWSPVEPQLEEKLYVPGVGEIKEWIVAGGHESFELAKVSH